MTQLSWVRENEPMTICIKNKRKIVKCRGQMSNSFMFEVIFFFVILNKIRHWNLRGTFTFKWGFFFFCLYIRKKGDFWIKCLLPKRSGNPFSAENNRKVSVGNHTLKLGWKSLINSKPRFGYIRKSWNETFFFPP